MTTLQQQLLVLTMMVNAWLGAIFVVLVYVLLALRRK